MMKKMSLNTELTWYISRKNKESIPNNYSHLTKTMTDLEP